MSSVHTKISRCCLSTDLTRSTAASNLETVANGINQNSRCLELKESIKASSTTQTSLKGGADGKDRRGSFSASGIPKERMMILKSRVPFWTSLKRDSFSDNTKTGKNSMKLSGEKWLTVNLVKLKATTTKKADSLVHHKATKCFRMARKALSCSKKHTRMGSY